MDLIDSHAHLDLLKHPVEALARAAGAGIGQVVTIGIDLASSQKAAAFASEYDNVFHTVGLHPHDAAQASERYWAEFLALARESGAQAIGECGLDFFRDLSPRELQREAFVRQIHMALELKLPLIIHDRDAHDEVAALLRSQGADQVGGVVHCFSGDWDLAKKVMDLGFKLGIDGPVTYPKNEGLREVCRKAGLANLLLETDCPFLSPQKKRGKPNEPAYLVYTCEGLAQALGEDPEEVARVTSANTRAMFGLPGEGA